MMALTLALIFLPFIPILRSIPRWSRVYRLIWRRHYRELADIPEIELHDVWPWVVRPFGIN